jgi:predicted NBD/HSP70 family sugar kinase
MQQDTEAKQTLSDVARALALKLEELAALFEPETKITLVIRFPPNPVGPIGPWVMGNDDVDDVAVALEVSKHQRHYAVSGAHGVISRIKDPTDA